MTYPRRCPLCEASYEPDPSSDLSHVTVGAEPGGTPSPQFPTAPGRVLTLHCQTCGGEYPWDFFADAVPLGAAVPARRPGRQVVRRRTPAVVPTKR